MKWDGPELENTWWKLRTESAITCSWDKTVRQGPSGSPMEAAILFRFPIGRK